VDIAVPGDSNILHKETEKYQDLTREIKRIWKSRTKVVPVVVGALGCVKEAGRLLGATRNYEPNTNDAKVGTPQIGTYPQKSVGSLRSRDER